MSYVQLLRAFVACASVAVAICVLAPPTFATAAAHQNVGSWATSGCDSCDTSTTSPLTSRVGGERSCDDYPPRLRARLRASAGFLATKGGPAATGNAGRIDALTRQAAEQYPNLAGKVHKHHVTPKYLGGQADGPLVQIDAAYHQLITNEFRRLAPYGGPRPGAARLEEVRRQVYNEYPLPE